jgi:hypothetical protein
MVSLGTVLEVTVDHLTPALVGGGIGIQVYGQRRKMVPPPSLDPLDLLRCLSRISETINRTSSANTTKARRALMCPTAIRTDSLALLDATSGAVTVSIPFQTGGQRGTVYHLPSRTIFMTSFASTI